MEPAAYTDTVYWLERLAEIQVPAPKVIAKGSFQGYEYLILSYLEGQDLGIIYPQLTKEEKRRIAAEIVDRLNGIYDRLWTEWKEIGSFESNGVIPYFDSNEEKEIHMKQVIHIYGASGSGTSTLGRKISEELGYRFMDTDDYFWLPTNPKYTTKRCKEERLALMKQDISEAEHVVISGSLVDWGDELIPLFTLAIRLVTDTETRIARLKEREAREFGNRILPGGDMYENHMEFLEWAGEYDTGGVDMRSKAKHDVWQKLLHCRQIVLDGAEDLEKNLRKVQAALDPVIGRTVTVTVDRPLGSTHPSHPDMVYPINYGYVAGIMAPDGEEQDAYVVGVEEAVQQFTGKVIAIVHRYDDVEEKWVVAPEGSCWTKEEIAALIDFQEQYFDSEIRMENGSGNE